MTAATIAELRESLAGPSEAYREKQLHQVPDAPSVDREKFIIERCKGKTVIDVGASGPMHDGILKVAKRCYGIDRPPAGWFKFKGAHIDGDNFGIDLDDYWSVLPRLAGVDLIVCGEVLEHLSNPGHFLAKLQKDYRSVPVLITVPNAFADAGRGMLNREGIENCNSDHVAWYSHRTIKTLLNRNGYFIMDFAWYNGRPKFAEGMIVIAEGAENGEA
jgi:hypothetical protein